MSFDTAQWSREGDSQEKPARQGRRRDMRTFSPPTVSQGSGGTVL